MTDTDNSFPQYITLPEAARLIGRKASTLWNERDKGNLVCYRIGGVDYTTRQNIEDMFEKCRVKPKDRIFISANGKAVSQPLSSSTEDMRRAQDSARNAASRLKNP